MRFSIETPRVPSFVKVYAGRKSDYVPLRFLDEEDLEQICKDWREALFKARKMQIAEEEYRREMGY